MMELTITHGQEYTTVPQFVMLKCIEAFFLEIAKVFHFSILYFKEVFRPSFEFEEIGRQCYQIGVRSLPLITLTGFIIGLVFTKQSRPALLEFGATSWLPSMIGIAVIRALAPLVTALICAGRVGSGIGAELGTMKVTEQIDAMEVSATNPYKYLVVTRVTASTLMTPLLMLYTALIGLLGSFIDVHLNEHTSFTAFSLNAFKRLTFLDLASSLTKATFYGFTIGMVSCYQGFHAVQGTKGVGRAANKAVVYAMYLIFIEEMLIVQVINGIR
jgi:phospholipid/cholesterol/gamma-HCH transport system permease protein